MSDLQFFIQLSENSKDVKLLYVGNFKHSLYGEFEVTEKDLQNAVNNFNNKIAVRLDESGNPELPGNYQHSSYEKNPENSKASGWIKSLYLKGKELYAKMEWTAKALEYIKNKEFKYISPEFAKNWTDENGKKYGFTVLGVALTNVNFLKKNMPALAFMEDGENVISFELKNEMTKIPLKNNLNNNLNEKQGVFIMLNEMVKILNLNEGSEDKDILEAVKKLTEDNAAFESKVQDLEKDINEKTENVKELTDKVTELEKEEKTDLTEINNQIKTLTEKNTELENRLKLEEAGKVIDGYIFNLTTGKGKIFPKQKEDWIKLYLNDSDGIKKVLDDMPDVINYKESGTSNNSQEKDTDPTVELNRKAAELAEKEKIEFADAMNKVLDSDADLKERYFKFSDKE